MSDMQNKDSSAASKAANEISGSKAVVDIAKAAATGNMPAAAAVAIASTARKWAIPVILLILPFLVVAMIPTLVLGPLLSDGSDTQSGMVDEQALNNNLIDLNTSISRALSEGLADAVSKIDADFSTSGLDEKEVKNLYGTDVVYNANALVSMYCAYKNTDTAGISKEELEQILTNNKTHLYSFTYEDETRAAEVDSDDPDAESTVKTVRVYTIVYNGEKYFESTVFNLSDDQKTLSQQYAQNLTLLLEDGVYQGLTSDETADNSTSYEGVIFTEGVTQVTYFNQLDERWKGSPYGTDNVGGYGCGPTSMSIVVSSLTSETVDPPHMAKWAYENGHWCSGSGSFHSLIPSAAEEWGLNVEGCTPNEPQRIVDALSSGKLVVAIMGRGHFTRNGHFIVLRGVTSEGKVQVADPASYSRSQQEWDMSIILSEASCNAANGGPFWIIGN